VLLEFIATSRPALESAQHLRERLRQAAHP
jgi:hypothetical protein